jgi:hypothetical protein
MEQSAQEVESECQSEAREVLDKSEEQREESDDSQEVPSKICNEADVVQESLHSSETDIVQKGDNSNPSYLVRIDEESTGLEAVQDTTTDSEFQISNISKRDDEFDDQDSGMGTLIITSMNMVHRDITDENPFETMEAAEKNDENIEIAENEEDLLKVDDEGNLNEETREEVYENIVLKEKETEDEQTDKGGIQQVVEEKLGKYLQEHIVSSTEFTESMTTFFGTEHTSCVLAEKSKELEESEEMGDGNSAWENTSEKQKSTSDVTEAQKDSMEADVTPTESSPKVEKSEVADSEKFDEMSKMMEDETTDNCTSVLDPASEVSTESTADKREGISAEPSVEDLVIIEDKDGRKGRFTASCSYSIGKFCEKKITRM